MILATQSLKELEESGMLHIVSESCPTKIFLANPEMDRELYREAFHLNDTELELIAGLVPPGQMLIRKAQSSKKVQLNVDSVSHWMATNNARDNLTKREYFARFGIPEGLRQLAKDYPFRPRTTAGTVNIQSRRSRCMNRSLPLSTALMIVLSASAVIAQDPAARTVQVHSQDIVPIHAKLKYTTLIEVPPSEKIMEAATGDKEFWVVDVVGNFCFVHPAKAGIASNLNLITDKGNIYSFTLQDVSDTSSRARSESACRACRSLLARRFFRARAVCAGGTVAAVAGATRCNPGARFSGRRRIQECVPPRAEVRLFIPCE